MTPAIDIVSFTIKNPRNAKYQYRFRDWGTESWGYEIASIASDLDVKKEDVIINKINDNHLVFNFTSKKDKYICGNFNRNTYYIKCNDEIKIGINRKEYPNFVEKAIKGFNDFFEEKLINENTKLIDLTNEEEVINYILSQCDETKITREKLIKNLQKAMNNKIMNLLNNFKLSDECWIFNMDTKYGSDSFKKYFAFRNDFPANMKVDEEDRFLTDYELIQKYGREWWHENSFPFTNCLREDLNIEELKWVSKRMSFVPYQSWIFKLSKNNSIIPAFYQTNDWGQFSKKIKAAQNFRIPVDNLKN